MEKINQLIAEKKQNLESLEQQKANLEDKMANPTLLNSIAQDIRNIEDKIVFLSDVTGLMEEAGNDSAKKILTDVKDYYEERKQIFIEQGNKQQSIEDATKLQEIIDDIIHNDLSDTDESSETTKSDSEQKPDLSASDNGHKDTDMSEDTDLPDFSSFDD